MKSSLLISELGIKSPMLKILDFLIDNESFEYSKTDIAEGTELSRATLFKAWPKLEALDLITATRMVGQAKMYKLNKQNPIVKKLMELDDTISEHFARRRDDVIELRRAPGTCCPEPSCDYRKGEECEMCGHRCDTCEARPK